MLAHGCLRNIDTCQCRCGYGIVGAKINGRRTETIKTNAWVAFLNYGPLLTNAGFDHLVCDLEQAGVIAFPESTG